MEDPSALSSRQQLGREERVGAILLDLMHHSAQRAQALKASEARGGGGGRGAVQGARRSQEQLQRQALRVFRRYFEPQEELLSCVGRVCVVHADEKTLFHQVSGLPCNVRRDGGQSLVIGGSSLVILQGKACHPL